MAYTSNVPQGNQQIATTQPTIQANFGFIPAAFSAEHNFNASGDGSDTYHKFTSMPNQADPSALPAGTNGQYYVSGGVPKFYNTVANFLQFTPIPFTIRTGTVNLNNNFNITFFTFPANSVGMYWLFQKAASDTVDDFSAAGMVMSDADTLSPGPVFDPGIDITTAALNLRAKPTSSSGNATYTYTVIYYNP